MKLDTFLDNSHRGMDAKWSAEFCLTLIAEAPDTLDSCTCPICRLPMSSAPLKGTAQWMTHGFVRCDIGCQTTELDACDMGIALPDLLVMLHLAPSKSEARRLVEGKSITVSGVKVTDPKTTVADLPRVSDALVTLRVGKTPPWLFRLV